MDELIANVVLGLVQGVAEWLPISSSGHLVIAKELMGLEQSVAADVLLHVASLIVIFIVFWKDIWALLKGLFKKEKESWRLAKYIIVASVPAGIVGLLFKDFLEGLFTIETVGFALLFTTFMLVLSWRLALAREKKGKKANELTAAKAGLIGVAQAIAITPGVSRSGSTISSGLILGLDKKKAATFSFLMAIPAIGGAALLELPSLFAVGIGYPLIAGFFVALISGYLSLRLLLWIVDKQKLHVFAAYTFLMGLAMIWYAFFR